MDEKGEKSLSSVVFETYDGVGVWGGMETTLFILWQAKPKPFTIWLLQKKTINP